MVQRQIANEINYISQEHICTSYGYDLVRNSKTLIDMIIVMVSTSIFAFSTLTFSILSLNVLS